MTNSSALLWFSTLAGLGSLACSGAEGGSPSSEEPATTLTQELRGSPASYVTLRRDVRRCASPLCGGFFIDSVNQDTLRCADGSRSAECYVSDLDLSALGLNEKQEGLIRSEPTTFLLLGELRPRRTRFGRLGDLVVSEAWQGQTGETPSAPFFRARNEGIVCITFPCLSFSAELLNRRDSSTPIAEIDLSRVTQDPSAAFEQLNAPDGLLLSARRFTSSGPAGSARGLRASEFYLPFVAEAQACGSRGLSQCDVDSFCSFPPEANCGRSDAPGTCAPRPEVCILIFDPVCGCDGQTYSNSCSASSAGVSVEHDGACEGSE